MDNKPSEKSVSKLEAKRNRNRATIKQAAWQVFAEKGLDGANVRDIVTRSGMSVGTFYNYYGTLESVFHELLVDMTVAIRALAQSARARETELEPMLRNSNIDFLRFVRSVEYSLPFVQKNQHHVRSYLSKIGVIEDIAADFRVDLLRAMPNANFEPREMNYVASLVLATVLEFVLQSVEMKEEDIDEAATFIARLLAGGIEKCAGRHSGASPLAVS